MRDQAPSVQEPMVNFQAATGSCTSRFRAVHVQTPSKFTIYMAVCPVSVAATLLRCMKQLRTLRFPEPFAFSFQNFSRPLI